MCGNVTAVDGVVKGVTKAITPSAAKQSKPAAEEGATQDVAGKGAEGAKTAKAPKFPRAPKAK